jgi:Na+:H+ antiporter, NhaA family
MPPNDTTANPGPERGPVGRVVAPLLEFLATETGGAVVLLGATIAALVWANSPWSGSYDSFWHQHVTLGAGDARLSHDLRHWINEGLMTFFFLVVGLEIKRELVAGELDSVRKALVPAVAAVGGMVVPALVYVAFTAGGPGAAGWGIPMATDIAFAIGALSFFGRSLSPSARAFLLGLAIVDDIGAIVLIAVFYSSGASVPALLAGAALVTVIAALRRAGLGWAPLYVALGVALWIVVSKSGVHATIAGVVLGLLVPARAAAGGTEPPTAQRLVHALHPWTSFVIVPLFALANAGVELSGESLGHALTSAVGLGIIVGLVAGKLLGVLGATWAAVGLGLRPAPDDGWTATAGIGALAGIGFTVSLFVAELAFAGRPILAEAKIGVLVGSITATALGALILRRARRATPRAETA